MPIGQRTTANAASESRAVRRVDENIALLEPNIAPLITLMNKMKRRKSIDQTKTEWLEDDYAARWAQNGTATVASNAGSTTITVTDASAFVPGNLFVVPKSTTSLVVPEVIRVVTVNTGTNVITVARAVGGVGLDTISANAAFRLIGSAYEEGGLPPNMKSTAPVTKFNYTQIFKTVIDYSKTGCAINQYGVSGSDRDREQKKKLKEHKEGMNADMLWGVKSEDLTGGPTGKPLRTMGGINQFLTSNIYDMNGTLNRKSWEAFSRMTFRYGSKSKLLLAAPLISSAFNEWGNSWLSISKGETVLGVQIRKIITAHGEFMLVNDWMLEDSFAQTGFGHVAFALDMDEIEYRPLSNNGENRDTHIREDIIKDGRDSYTDEILTECSMKVGQEKYHSKLINVTDYIV